MNGFAKTAREQPPLPAAIFRHVFDERIGERLRDFDARGLPLLALHEPCFDGGIVDEVDLQKTCGEAFALRGFAQMMEQKRAAPALEFAVGEERAAAAFGAAQEAGVGDKDPVT